MKDELKKSILAAFADTEYPGDWCLKGSNEGKEPFLLEQEFKGKSDWKSLDLKFLDKAPGGLSSALSFFSDEAFRFYIPAYILADIDGNLRNTDVVFHLTHGLDNKSSSKKINPRRYGERTWLDEKRYKFSIFSPEQRKAIEGYLKFKFQSGDGADFENNKISEALENYWSKI